MTPLCAKHLLVGLFCLVYRETVFGVERRGGIARLFNDTGRISDETDQPLVMKSVLAICEDAWHPAETVRCGLALLRAGGFEVEFLEDGVKNLAEILPDFSIVLLARANVVSAADSRPWLEPDSVAALQEHLQRGNGLVAIHAGTSRYEQSPGMTEMIGGAFRHHPDQCTVTMEPRIGHPLAHGVKTFTVRDEHYFMTKNDAAADVFLHSRSEHGVQPAGWTRTGEGGGRVCVLTPGHNLEVWLHLEFQKLLVNGLNWVAKPTQ